MIFSYLIFYFRSLLRNKAISLINILGLSVGLASCFVIMLFVVNELNVDKFQKNRKTVYRVMIENKDHTVTSHASFLFGPTIKQEFPEVENFARVVSFGSIRVKKANKFIEELHAHFADQSVFDLLTFTFLEGKRSEALVNPNSVVISESMAMKYFGSRNVVGNRLEVMIKGEEQLLSVSGVFADLPESSSIKIDFLGEINFGKRNLMKMLIHYGTGETSESKEMTDSWDFTFYTNLIKVSEKYDISKLELKVNKAFKKYHSADDVFHYSFQRYDRMYLHSMMNDSSWRQGNLSDIYVFSSTALLILLIASFNYVILTLAQSEKRAKEIGIRKVSGANFKKLSIQVLVESVAISVLALPIAVGLTELILPMVNALLDKNLVIDYSQNIVFVLGTLGITLSVSFISGLYISLYLNKFNPVTILRGSSVRAGVRSVFLKSLVIAQMTIFIGLMISAGIIVKQLNFVSSYNPGLDPENVLYIPLNDVSDRKNYQVIRQELEKLPEIASVSAATNNPPSSFVMNMQMPRVDQPSKMAVIEVLMVDFNYIETMGLTIREGRDFSHDFPGDSTGLVINESAIKELGLTDPIGQKLPGGTIIGVVKDFPIHDLHSKIPPAYFTINSRNLFEMAVKTKTDAVSLIPKIKKIWNKVNPDSRFSCNLYTVKMEDQYQSERTLSKIIVLFTIIAILIACLGLFGLSRFISLIRTKEIGIRKVNGGTLVQMIFLFWKELYGWIAIAFAIACPVSWYVMHRWLENFAYQAYKSASCNPVDALRYE
jgi:putative ABC transport system permease protein